MNSTRNDMSENARVDIVALIQPRLVDALDLYTQMKQAHWNVRGPSFISLHELFDTIAAEILAHSDMMAERITAIGGQAEGTARIVAETSSLAEYPAHISTQAGHVDAVANALATFAKNVRAAARTAADLGDDNTADMFTEISRAADKSLWLVEAHVESAAE